MDVAIIFAIVSLWICWLIDVLPLAVPLIATIAYVAYRFMTRDKDEKIVDAPKAAHNSAVVEPIVPMAVQGKDTSPSKYYALWNSYASTILKTIGNGGGIIKMKADDFTSAGDRKSYTFSLTIVNGNIPVDNGKAQSRDLRKVLMNNPKFQQVASGKTIYLHLTTSFELEVRVKPM